MKNCFHCGVGFPQKRSNQIYCSVRCKNNASKDRQERRRSLSDGNNNSLSLVPVSQLPSTASIVTAMANTVINKEVGSISLPAISDVVMNLQDSSVKPRNKALLVGSVCVGGVVGYQLAGRGRRFSGVVIGGLSGALLYQLIFPFVKKDEDLSPMLSDTSLSVYTCEDISRMSIQTLCLSLDSCLGSLVGGVLNERFSILLYGEAGGGKSHLATILAYELCRYGRVLYVLAEEDITSSVRERIVRYGDSDAVNFIVCSDEQKILEKLQGYDFLVLDSLNGMLRFNYHTDFLRRLKALKLRGMVLVNQVNKSGHFVGNNAILHEVDVEMVVSSGVAEVGKNRFGISGGRYSIFGDAVCGCVN